MSRRLDKGAMRVCSMLAAVQAAVQRAAADLAPSNCCCVSGRSTQRMCARQQCVTVDHVLINTCKLQDGVKCGSPSGRDIVPCCPLAWQL
jgi:hypothetical protein